MKGGDDPRHEYQRCSLSNRVILVKFQRRSIRLPSQACGVFCIQINVQHSLVGESLYWQRMVATQPRVMLQLFIPVGLVPAVVVCGKLFQSVSLAPRRGHRAGAESGAAPLVFSCPLTVSPWAKALNTFGLCRHKRSGSMALRAFPLSSNCEEIFSKGPRAGWWRAMECSERKGGLAWGLLGGSDARG